MNFENKTFVSHPYAEAAFKFSSEINKTEKWLYMLTESCTALKFTPHILSNIYFFKLNKKNFFNNLSGKIDVYFENFLKIIAYNDRLIILPNILKKFIEIKNISENIEIVQIITKFKLNQKLLEDIKFLISNKIKKKIKVQLKIEKSLLGGIVIKSKNFIIDSSIKNRLNKLSEYL
ncbi:ATP synthase delta chain [Wigglesworthia glossinidia endosymbiont of Glossina morsitans morsitans (Yale colony)]|uniref:ATP synthase subunit delta n=1 Tax=Wigglesworthia glossinidia endosymbiont of Glossina morsitans morsitans (Yale colony) TaxID=1142511 RepID=H6Q484_WIGGL|nr:F0F1 ATP synthase subunit delta [Wigglesworthia glossinidia]AFA40867.1 ATP synthase delta chain [Wigglesworthia glossinidia endosymbiont of Glossina morsitans morsitans (Yale colony)]